MTFAWPWAFLGLLALPALAAIYWLRQRARRRPVSSLLLWRDAPVARASGRRFERFEASRTFLLELLILALLTLAAAGPRLPGRETRRPLVVVLDDSFSMLAVPEAGAPTVRQAAVDALLRELDDGRHGAVTLVAAGERPQVLDDAATAADDVAERLARWRATSPAADLDSAVALSGGLAGGRARLLVLSDRPPPQRPESAPDYEPIAAGRLAWWAFGRAAPNLAVVGAMRGAEGGGESADACLVEVANYSPRPAVARLILTAGEAVPAELPRLELGAGEVGRVRFSVPRGREARLRLAGDGTRGDALAFDDQAILLPERRRSVRVGLEIDDADLQRLIRDALEATERAILSAERAQLVIADAAAREQADGAAPAAWRLRLVTGEPAVPYLGPFVLDRGHPLTEGLSLDGVIWAAGAPAAGAPAAGAGGAAGEPVITAGDAPLLTDRETAGGRHDLTLFWRPELSSLQRTPNWPILWWNLLEWRARSLPGARAANLRLGAEAIVGLTPGAGDAELELPDGTRLRLAGRDGRLAIRAEQLGIHRLRHGGRTDRWAVNALAAEESDLRNAASGRWGGWGDQAAERWQRRGVGWIPLLLAAAGLVLHLTWTGRR